ncbi:MAG: hypothetical protein U0269_31700 [Polyangiales bacterium]
MRRTAIVGLSSLVFALVSRPAFAQRCELRQPEGVELSSRGGQSPRVALSQQGLVVAWTQQNRSGSELMFRSVDPSTMRPRSRAQRLALTTRNAALSPVRLSVAADATILATGCTCANNTLTCASSVAAGSGAAPTWSTPAASVCGVGLLSVATSGHALLATAATGANRALLLFSASPLQAPAIEAPNTSKLELIGIDGDRFALVRHSPLPGSITVLDARGAARPAIPFGAGARFAADPIRYGGGLLTVLFQQSSSAQPPAHTIVTMNAAGAVSTAPLALPTQRITSTSFVPTMVNGLAPSSAGCFLVSWSQSDHREVFIGRVCNNTLDPSSTASLRRPNGVGEPALVSDGQRAFIAWRDDTRDTANSTVRVSELGCR